MCCADFLEVHAAPLVQLMLHTLPIYQDIASQRAVLATVRQAVTNGTFLKTLAGAIVKLDAETVSRQVNKMLHCSKSTAGALCQPSLLPTLDAECMQECFVLLCWTAVVLRQLQVSSAKKAVIKLVECQVHFVHTVSCLQVVFPANSQYACGIAVLMQAAYLSRLQAMPATAENMLKVTDRLLSAKPDLLPEYVIVAKSKGTDAIISA